MPSILLVVSCFVLVICQKTVVVGDDSKMRFKCVAEQDIDDEKDIIGEQL